VNKLLFALLLFSCSFTNAETAPSEILAATPPMGWNSWNHFGCNISDADVRAQADAMASNGMREAGYSYVVIDDCWQSGRGNDGVLIPNAKFPDMKKLADYVHAKGLKFGIYSSPGPLTCAKHEGSFQHEDIDAKTFAAWGVDYLKYDWCSAKTVYPVEEEPKVFRRMGTALRATGRPIVYSLSNYGINEIWIWGPSTGAQLWRTTGDIAPYFESILAIGFGQAGLERFAGPGHWNDPDMLEIGNGRIATTEISQFHMSLWCLLSAPLMAGNDLATMTDSTREVLTNREVIALDQDALGIQGRRVYSDGPIEVWTKPLMGGDIAIGIFNKGESTVQATVLFREIGLPKIARIRDLWHHTDSGLVKDALTASPQPHGVVLLRAKPIFGELTADHSK
jgi:alpha-galactosidase